MSNQLLRVKNSFRAPLFRALKWRKEKFHCPVCDYRGPFIDKKAKKKIRSRLNAKCPSCSAMERHRFQWFVLQKVLAGVDLGSLSVLHFAPEPCLEDRLRARCGRYITTDLLRTTVDCQFDVTAVPFDDEVFDLVLNSHVLQYVEDDLRAVSELSRILKPGGMALLPVPLLHLKTVAMEVPDPILGMYNEPGPDYFDRYEAFFERVDLHYSSAEEDQYHFYLELLSAAEFPLKLEDMKYGDIIPVCYKG
jgi:SAM-dependent methyltransferase